jgi:predicted MFS family arabinose efflux permease
VALLVTGRLQPWMIIALAVVVGVTDALSMPSFQSIVPSIVSRADIRRGLALNATQFNLSRVLGPSIAGVLMASAGAMACFVVSAVSYLPFIGVALWVLPRWTPAPPRGAGPPGRHALAGLGDVLRQPHLRGALLTVLATGVLCAPLVTFSPVLVKQVFQGGAGHFSLAVASFGVGGLLGAAGLLTFGPEVDGRRLGSGFAVACGVAVALAALVPWFWALPPLLVVAGAAMTLSNTAANSLLQATASPGQLGRTVSLYLLAMRGGISLGALLTGAAAGWLGVQRALLLDGLVAVAVQVVVARRWARAPLPRPDSA